MNGVSYNRYGIILDRYGVVLVRSAGILVWSGVVAAHSDLVVAWKDPQPKRRLYLRFNMFYCFFGDEVDKIEY